MMSSAPPLGPLIEVTHGRKVRQSTQRLSRPARRRAYLSVLLVSDKVLSATVFALADALRFYSGLPMFETKILRWPACYAGLIIVFIAAWLARF